VKTEPHSEVEATGFYRDDGLKLRLDLVPPEALFGLSDILTYGARKYADRNWERGGKWGRSYASALRHLLAFWAGEDMDSESGLPHIDHVLANVVFLSTYQKRGIGVDDRHKIGQADGA